MIRIGTCGYSGFSPEMFGVVDGNWKQRYADKLQAFADAFDTVELNRTFYKLPMEKTARRWREEVPDGFRFSLKAWQAITHPTSSATWRKRTDRLTRKQQEGFGELRPNNVTIDAWNRTIRIARILWSPVIVVQTPPGFEPSENHIENIRWFLSSVERAGVAVAWEPRGEWNERLGLVQDLCNELDLIHVVDPFRRFPQSPVGTCYVRLHGRNERETDYHYEYDRTELDELAGMLRELDHDHDTVYCMFNNISMYDNALTLQSIL